MLTASSVSRRAVLPDQLRTHTKLSSDVGDHRHWHRVGRTKWPARVPQQSELYCVTEPVVIPAMSANAFQIIIRKRVVAGNLPLSHIEMQFEKLPALGFRQQLTDRNCNVFPFGGDYGVLVLGGCRCM